MRLRLPALLTTALSALSTVALSLGVAAPASAITGGEPDGTDHPNVALIAFYGGGLQLRCSATLVTPTVLLTAAHCTTVAEGKTAVTFESTIAEERPADGRSPLPPAADPAAGYTPGDLAGTGFLSGTPHAHPQYSHFTDRESWNDVGVVVLDRPVTGLRPAWVAPTGFLDAYAQPTLSSTLFTFVGYGTEVRKAQSGPQKPAPMAYPLVRRVTTSPGQKLTPQILQANGNPNDPRGGGGTCFGDSGGPGFLDGYVVTVTSYGLTSNCRYLGGYQRVDIPVVQDWLATFGVEAATA